MTRFKKYLAFLLLNHKFKRKLTYESPMGFVLSKYKLLKNLCFTTIYKMVSFLFRSIVYVFSLIIFNRKRRRHFIEKYSRMDAADILKNTMANIIKPSVKNVFLKKKSVKKFDYKLLVRQNNFYNRLQSLKIDTPIDLMNSGIFKFGGGLTDQFAYLAGMIDIKKWGGYKSYFINTHADHGDENLTFRHFNVKKYFDYEFIKLPNSIIDLYGKCGLSEAVEPPFLFNRRGDISLMIKKYPDILQLQTPLNEPNLIKLEEIKNTKNSVCMHIRMGDCLKPGVVGYLPKKSYFYRSIERLRKSLGKDMTTFFIFTTSQNLARARFTDYDMKFVDVNDDDQPHFELELMKNCQHFITSGGGFSRLASMLSTNKNKIIINPLNTDFCGNIHDREKEWEYKWDYESGDWRNIKIV
jgi:hypothetical protein